MALINIGILAHVDAGKTSLTERILYHTGVLDRPGSVDAGNTVTDSMALERERGITIRSAVVSFAIGDLKVNLIDTPGHADFIAEVERALRVLDGVVLVVSAVEGVQPQTRRLMRTLRALGMPTVLFVNKIDRLGAREPELLDRIRAALTPDIVPIVTVEDIGTAAASVRPAPADPALVERLAERRADHDDEFLAEYLAGGWQPTAVEIRAELCRQARLGWLHPVYFGSAVTGAGIVELLAGIAAYLPRAAERDGETLSGTVFAIQRGRRGERIAYARIEAGILCNRRPVRCFRPDGREYEGRPTALQLFVRGASVPADRAGAGEIAQLTGLTAVRIGDRVGSPAPEVPPAFPPPALESVVAPVDPTRRADLYVALGQLAEQDPMIAIRTEADVISACLFGEVQKEVIAARLEAEFGIAATFAPTSAICVERPAGRGESAELITDPGNGFFATVGLRVEPVAGEGIEYRLEVEPGGLLPAFRKAIEETVHEVLRQGLYGWQVRGCRVTLTHSGYWAPLTAAGDFRGLVPLVLADALRKAGTVVYQPIRRFELDLPAGTLGDALAALAGLGAEPDGVATADGVAHLDGTIPADAVYALEQRLPRLTHGEGDLTATPHGYAPVTGPPPERPRTGPDPLNRKEYLRLVITSR